MKKLIAFLVTCSILMVPMTASATTMRDTIHETYAAFSATFPDVPKTHLNFEAVAMLEDDGTIQGYPDGTFKPDGQVNRAELMKMTVAMFYPKPDGDVSAYENCFPDVTNDWYAYYVCKGKELGWVAGYPDGTFKPGNSVNRVEAIKIIINAMIQTSLWPSPTEDELALPLPADADLSAWYISYLQFSLAKDLLDRQHVTGTAEVYNYLPGDPMTRKEVAETIYRTFIYMSERVEYVDMMVATECFQLSHTDMTEEDAYALWLTDILGPSGYTEAEADELNAAYTTDDVLNVFKADVVEFTCGDKESVDMTKWTGFFAFAK